MKALFCMLIKNFLSSSKNEIFSPGQRFKVESKSSSCDQQSCWRKIWDSIGLKGILEEGKDDSRATILVLRFIKTSFCLREIEDKRTQFQITINIWSGITSKSNSAKYYEMNYSWSKRIVEENWHHGRNWNGSKVHSIKQSIINGIILVVLICWRRIRFRKIKSSLWIDL